MAERIRKGDLVMVISGQYESTRGRVIEVFPKKQKALVEGVNIVKKHQKARSQEAPGGIVEAEAPIHMCKLMLVDSTGAATRVKWTTDANGNKIRMSKKSNTEIV